MSAAGDAAPDPLAPNPFEDALLAVRLCAIDPGLGGIVLRGGGSLRDAVLEALREIGPVRRIPAHIDDERLLGGIDLTATLARGHAVSRAGLLAEADGGVVVVPMAERLSDAIAGRLAAVIDACEVVVERDGVTLRRDTQFLTVALDDGIDADERPPAALLERLAFRVDLSTYRHPGLDPGSRFVSSAATGRSGVADQVRDDGGGGATNVPYETIAGIAAALGIDAARAPLFALRAARAAGRLAGRDTIIEEDVLLAIRLVLAPRATRLPKLAEQPPPEPPPSAESEASDRDSHDPGALDDVVLAAALAALPRDVLARIAAGHTRRRTPDTHGAGQRRQSGARGRPMGARAGLPGGGRRLSLIDTLRVAAPWQKLRGAPDCDGKQRVAIRRDDLRIRRFETRAEALTIFAVDASGSSALARLAEAKGAVELLLAEAYVKRAQVALVAFRGTTAELLLPPTRSLARARRALAELPGGGGTPLAAGLNAARDLAEAARAKGRTPFVVVLTDGRANIAADGSAARARAGADAEAAATAIGTAGIACAFVDISARPGPEGAALAAAMRARYLPLPRADARAMHAAVRAAQGA